MTNKKLYSMRTEDLEHLLEQSDSIRIFQEQALSQSRMQKLQHYLLELLAQKKKSPQDILNQANFSKSYYYKILNGEKHPSRDILLQLAILLGATIEETNHLLKYAKYAPLYVKDLRDAVIYHSILKHCSLIETNMILDDENHLLLD